MKLPAELEKDINIIKNYFLSKDYENTISKSKKILKKLPNNSYLLNIIGLSLNALGRFKEAKEIFIKNIKFDPNNLVIKNNYSSTLKNLDEIEEAEKILENIVEQEPEYIHALNNLANIKRERKDYNTAIFLYKKILKINEKLPLIHYNIALSYLQNKEKELAKKHALIVNNLDSKFILADQIINTLTDYKKDRHHLDQLKQKIKNLTLEDNLKSLVYFMLGKAYEDIEDYKNSFIYYKKANQIKRDTFNYDIKIEEKEFKEIKRIFKNYSSDQTQSENQTQKVIFICGMPRSGTTLVEQILSTHTKVNSMEETGFLTKFINKNNVLNKDISSQDFVSLKKTINNEFIKLASRYNFSCDYITDKSLFNFKYIGFIKIFFPESKILVLKRNFENNFFSIYKNTFQSKALNWAYKKEEIELYYELFNKYLFFWENIFPKSFEIIKYEDVVQYTEAETRKILDFCELKWEKDCLKYYEKNTSPISTISSHQASKPIYLGSVDKFKYFREFFQKKTAL